MQTDVMPTRSHLSDVAAAFDGIAGAFDENFENLITAELRRRLYSVVTSLVPGDSTIIDVNCGTGIDALFLAEHGYRVTGIDVSRTMIARARKKLASRRNLQATFIPGSFDDLPANHAEPVDLVMSNFGGINCSDNLGRTARAIGSVIKPGGYFVGVIMPRFSLWETVSFLLRLRWKDAARRMRGGSVATGFGEHSFRVQYYSPRDVRRSFGDGFNVKRISALSVVAPTPQSTGFARNHPRLVSLLFRLDNYLESIPVLRSIGDHYIIVLQKQ